MRISVYNHILKFCIISFTLNLFNVKTSYGSFFLKHMYTVFFLKYILHSFMDKLIIISEEQWPKEIGTTEGFVLHLYLIISIIIIPIFTASLIGSGAIPDCTSATTQTIKGTFHSNRKQGWYFTSSTSSEKTQGKSVWNCVQHVETYVHVEK